MPATKVRLDYAAYAIVIVAMLLLPSFMDDVFWLNRISKYLVYGMLGVAIAMAWGYAGVLNLGQGLFFGLGAYMLAMSLKLASPTSLAQGSDQPIPDFMMWTSEPGAELDLCCITGGSFLWIPFENQWFGVFMGIVLPVLVATLVGYVLFRLRISGVFIAIITLALVLLVRLIVIDAQPVTNGFNGLTDLGWFTVNDFELDPYFVETYYVIAVVTALVLIFARWLVSTRAGLILQSIRDDANRARFLGFNVAHYQTFFFAVSAGIAGLAGMLFVMASEFASPTFMDLAFSITMVVWAAVGGRHSLLGACIGAFLVNFIEDTVSETDALVEAWKAIIGLLFVLVVLFLPRGLAGFANDVVDRYLRFVRTPHAARRLPYPRVAALICMAFVVTMLLPWMSLNEEANSMFDAAFLGFPGGGWFGLAMQIAIILAILIGIFGAIIMASEKTLRRAAAIAPGVYMLAVVLVFAIVLFAAVLAVEGMQAEYGFFLGAAVAIGLIAYGLLAPAQPHAVTETQQDAGPAISDESKADA